MDTDRLKKSYEAFRDTPAITSENKWVWGVVALVLVIILGIFALSKLDWEAMSPASENDRIMQVK